jgi:hypothetical protein
MNAGWSWGRGVKQDGPRTKQQFNQVIIWSKLRKVQICNAKPKGGMLSKEYKAKVRRKEESRKCKAETDRRKTESIGKTEKSQRGK